MLTCFKEETSTRRRGYHAETRGKLQNSMQSAKEIKIGEKITERVQKVPFELSKGNRRRT